jgi:8-oxo-dGTP pyrophosphatase MutT (NUDIX family)
MSDPKRAAGADPHANPWKRLSRRTGYENAWITVHHDEVLRPDGRPGVYGVVHYKHRALGVLALDAEDRVLLVGQYRYTLDTYSWEIPEGGGAADEEPLAAAQRELEEETGYTARHWRPLVRSHLSNSVSDEEAICYLATDLQAGRARPEGTEQLQIRWVSFAEALAMAAAGEITDAMSIMTIQRFALLRASGS